MKRLLLCILAFLALSAAPAAYAQTARGGSETNASSNDLPAFFDTESTVAEGVWFLKFPNGNVFGYFSHFFGLYGTPLEPRYLYHFDMGYEYWFDANDGQSGIYFYDFTSGHFFYTSPTFPFPYLYDFSLNAVLYYFPDASVSSGNVYTTNPRYFYNFSTSQIITQ